MGRPSSVRPCRRTPRGGPLLHAHQNLAVATADAGRAQPPWAERVADLAHAALIEELETWPKPGLVSPVDSGSHDDMDADTLHRSAAAIRPFFADLVSAGS